MTAQSLIDTLVSDAKPVTRLDAARLLRELIPGFLAAALLVTLIGRLKTDLSTISHDRGLWVLCAILLALTAGSLVLTVRLARPGARKPRWAWPLIILGALAFVVPPIVMMVEDGASPFIHTIEFGGPRCFGLVLMASILPALLMMRWVRLGAATQPMLLAGTTALASASLGNFAMLLSCGMSDMRHILMSHGPAMLIVGVVVAGATLMFTRRW